MSSRFALTSLEQLGCLMFEYSFDMSDLDSKVLNIEQRKRWKGVLGDSNANKGVVGWPYQSARQMQTVTTMA